MNQGVDVICIFRDRHVLRAVSGNLRWKKDKNRKDVFISPKDTYIKALILDREMNYTMVGSIKTKVTLYLHDSLYSLYGIPYSSRDALNKFMDFFRSFHDSEIISRWSDDKTDF